MTRLNAQTLPELQNVVPGPGYDRGAVKTGIVHFGTGGFHRAHQAALLDALMNSGRSLEWGICGVGVLPGDVAMRDALQRQDGLYTLMVKHPDGTREPRIIGSIVEYLFAPDDPQAVIEKLSDPLTKIVTLTITEGGYNFDPSTGKFVQDSPDVLHDIVPGALPRTVFGLVLEAVRRRREAGTKPFVVVSCDNIQGNGSMAKASFVAFAQLKDAELADWMSAKVRFPNSMVDRITPRTVPEDIEEIRTRYGIDDEWPVVTEPFLQWVLEDDFDGDRPALEEVGVQLVRDVEPYELIKLRLLNSSHQGLAYFGHLAGYSLVHDAARDPLFQRFLLDYMNIEATPTLQPVEGLDLDEYKRSLIERFSNGEVKDTVARLAAESSDRIPKWLLPVVRDQLAAGRDVRRSAAIVASWARYAEGTDESGRAIDVVDNKKEAVMAAAAAQAADKLAFLRDETLFGRLVDEPRFVEAYTWALDSLHDRGARATLERLVAIGDESNEVAPE